MDAPAGKKERPAITAKKKQVEELKAQMGEYPTIALIDLRGLPDKLLQGMRKSLRETSMVKIAKSTVLRRAFEGAGKPAKLSEMLVKPTGLVLTKLSPYELNSMFRGNLLDMAAKPGQVSPEEIVVPAGETDLPPGPTLSELKVAGINAQIKGGKIVVAKDSTVVKEGDTITPEKAKALQTLGIKPFRKGVQLVLAFDGEYIYSPEVLGITPGGLAEDFVSSLAQAFNMSVNAAYPTPANVELILTESVKQGMNVALNGQVYSPESVEQLLALAYNQGCALSDVSPSAGEEAAEKPAEGESAPETEKEGELPPEKEGKPPEEKPEEK